MRLHAWLLLIGLLLPLAASAHQPGSSRLSLRTQDSSAVELRWDVALADANLAVQMDAPAQGGNGNGIVEPLEAAAAEAALFTYAANRLALAGDSGNCLLMARRPMQLAERADGRSLVLRFTAHCAALHALSLHTTLLLDADASHRSLLRAQWGAEGAVQSGVLSSTRPTFIVRREASSRQNFSRYFVEGIQHVLEGWDHLLFLLGLFLPVALRWQDGRWQPLASPGLALRQAATLVSAFTLAHAATLSLAALGVLTLPTRLVESAVAASVLFSGLNNLRPMVTQRLWLLAAGFGLVHGSAIAGALLELGLPTEGRLWALLGFNLGVEAIQLALALAVLPLGLALRRWRGYVPAILWPGSALVALAGLVWFIDRAFVMGWTLPV